MILCDVVEGTERATGELRLIKKMRLRAKGEKKSRVRKNDERGDEGANTFVVRATRQDQSALSACLHWSTLVGTNTGSSDTEVYDTQALQWVV